MAPAGGSIDKLSLDSRAFDPVVTQDLDGRPVAQVVTVLDKGETQEIEFELRHGARSDRAGRARRHPGCVPRVVVGHDAQQLRADAASSQYAGQASHSDETQAWARPRSAHVI